MLSLVGCFVLAFLFTASLFLLQLLDWELPSPKVIYNTFGRDTRAAFRYLKTQYFIRKCIARDLSVCDVFESLVQRYPNKTLFIFDDIKWTFKQVNDYSNQVANLFTSAGYEKGDEVALFMENRPEYVCIWLGLAKIGVIPAFINTNLRSQSLAHSINVITAKGIIFNAELLSAVKDVVPSLERRETLVYYCLGKSEEDTNSILVKSLDELLASRSTNLQIADRVKIHFKDKLFYIYTSGTTGLPKAAIIRHSRFTWIAASSKRMLCMKEDDIYYNPLPLYHTAGGMLFVSTVIMFGGTMVIRKKFSATNFWKDCIKYNATVSQYIGEICRYLLNQPKVPEDTAHTVRLMCGNGLKPQIWREFQERFKIKTIIELYGATEGNANVVNLFGKVGSVGFISRIFGRIHPVKLIKIDPITGQPERDKNGLCVKCKPGEAGEIVGKIIRNSPVNNFDGYANKDATKKKIISNCFSKGDTAFLSGDIMVMDEYGYLYFQDRTGDTYRWRGENVSTCEVEAIISKILGLVTCVVYGVEIPGIEGRAGMIAIQEDCQFDLQSLYDGLCISLPSYAVPRFIRICKNIETTGTYKLKKVELQKEGYNIDQVKEPLYVMDMKKSTYVPLDRSTYEHIINGNSRL